MNLDLVHNIKGSNNPITMQTNDGSRKIILKGQVGDQINTQFEPSHIANIFGFAHMKDKYGITCDSGKED